MLLSVLTLLYLPIYSFMYLLCLTELCVLIQTDVIIFFCLKQCVQKMPFFNVIDHERIALGNEEGLFVVHITKDGKKSQSIMTANI